MPDADPALLARARSHEPSDPEVRGCWDFVLRGIELGWLGPSELAESIGFLEEERDYGIEELLFAFSFADTGPRLRVSFLSDTATCSPAAMIASLALIAR